MDKHFELKYCVYCAYFTFLYVLCTSSFGLNELGRKKCSIYGTVCGVTVCREACLHECVFEFELPVSQTVRCSQCVVVRPIPI